MTQLTRRELAARALAGGAALALPAGLLTPAARAGGDPAVRELARAVRGPVLIPGEPGYDAARRVVNARFSGARPRAVVQPLGVGDVQAAVRWAARRDVRVVARSGGHSYGGWSTGDGVLVVDLRRLRAVRVDAGAGRGRLQAGVRLGEVYAALARHGATVPAGTCPSVGLGGLALGGGMGLASRRLGLTCDRVEEVLLVTADGRARRCDARSEPDLLWACRGGGGGNFGIALELAVRLHRVRGASWFRMSWPWSQASEALAAWLRWAPSTDPRLTSILLLSTGRGGPRVSALGQFLGPRAELPGRLRPLRRVAGARLRVGAAPYGELMRRWAGCLDESVAACTRMPSERFAASSDYLERELSPAGRRAALGVVERRQRGGGGGALIFDAYGGAINAVAPDATAFVHRRALCSIQHYASFGPGGTAAGLRWVREVRRALAPHASGEAYQNYADPGLRDWPRAYYGENLPRLREIKRRYDPDRLFDFPQAIR